MAVSVGTGGNSLDIGGVTININNNTGGSTVASRSGPITINIDVEDDAHLYDLLGRGLISVYETIPTDHKQIDVFLGQGLAFTDPDNSVMVQAGAGLGFDTMNNLVVELGNGLVFDDDNRITSILNSEDVIGEGLIIGTDNKIDVNCGDGLNISPGDNTVQVHIGDGLGIASDGSLVVLHQAPVLGPGLVAGSTGDIEAHIADGLTFALDGSIEVNAGAGLDFVNGAIAPVLGTGLVIDANGNISADNTVPAPAAPFTFTVLTDTQFSFKDSVLSIAKVFTTYTVSSSASGAVVSVEATSTSAETDAVTISGGYGFGFGIPDRPVDLAKPNFYKS